MLYVGLNVVTLYIKTTNMIEAIYKRYTKENHRYFAFITTGKSFWRKQRYEIWKKVCSYSLFAIVSFQVKCNRRVVTDNVKEDLIVSLTSFPGRIDKIWFPIESIVKQSVRPSKILLYLSKEEFDNEHIDRLKFLRKYEKYGLEVVWVQDNLRSHKKYYYAMQSYKDDVIITIDDDVYYSSDTIQRLLNLHNMNNYAVCANITRKIAIDKDGFCDYSKWDKFPDNKKYNGTPLLVAIGGGAILYPKAFRPDILFDVDTIRNCAFHADDLWLKAVELVFDYPVITGEYFAPPITTPSSQRLALLRKNCGVGNGNNIQWTRLVKEFNLFEFIKDNIGR